MQIEKERTGRYQGPDYFTIDWTCRRNPSSPRRRRGPMSTKRAPDRGLALAIASLAGCSLLRRRIAARRRRPTVARPDRRRHVHARPSSRLAAHRAVRPALVLRSRRLPGRPRQRGGSTRSSASAEIAGRGRVYRRRRGEARDRPRRDRSTTPRSSRSTRSGRSLCRSRSTRSAKGATASTTSPSRQTRTGEGTADGRHGERLGRRSRSSSRHRPASRPARSASLAAR